MNVRIIILLLCLWPVVIASAQSVAEQKFHESSNLFINGDNEGALASANVGLKQDPGHQKLIVLKTILEQQKKREEQKKKQEEQKKKQQQQQQEKKDQQKQDQKDQQKQEEEKKKQEQDEQKKQEQNESEQKEQDQEQKGDPKEQDRDDLPPEVKKRLQELDMPEEKAKMLLEAMRNQEIQYLQQDKRKATKKRTTRDNKPDW